jgi:hypothetical protein
MKEFQARTPGLKSIICNWDDWDEREARRVYEKDYKTAPETGLRHLSVLVLAEWESPAEADTARIEWLEANAVRREIRLEVGRPNFRFHTVREALDDMRHAPANKLTILDLPDALWLPISCAPKTAATIRVTMEDGTIHEEAHWACDMSGSDQPPFRGWFIQASPGRCVGIDEPLTWRPIKGAKVTL